MIRISTGAPVPNNADIVIPVENTSVQLTSGDGEELRIEIKSQDTSKNIRYFEAIIFSKFKESVRDLFHF